ncbi:MAG: hydrogenase iron-sulfur subunit, partial [Longimicrobiales bacterium]|nr:hydrogenase iron-sulfur subunit [Longimicrobiales bacterium]
DVAVVAALVHAFRMAVQDRAWGPRALAWVSGVVLFGIFLACGWTGYVMVWDTQAQLLAAEGARLLDVFPIFSEPISRAFAGEGAMPDAFFFLNLFAHIAIPVGVLLVLWIHVSRLARTNLMPPRRLTWTVVALLGLLSVAWPATLGPEADLLRIPTRVPLDVFYNGWVPLSRSLPPGLVWLALLGGLGAWIAVPWLTRPDRERDAPPSNVDPRFCTGCEQCYHDCPYEAISMVRRADDRPYPVALVDPGKCVSCGICAGSCAPMGVGPPGRTGRDQLPDVKDFLATHEPGHDEIVLVSCSRTAAGWGTDAFAGVPVLSVDCAGSLHTSVVEYLVRAGAGGVMVVTCPPRDCWNREGVAWLEERLYEGREAELKDRVDRTRLRVAYAGEGERRRLEAEVERFGSQIRALERALEEQVIDIDTSCDRPVVSVVEEHA